MDKLTKYKHPNFFLFLNLYFFFGDCETRVILKLKYKTGDLYIIKFFIIIKFKTIEFKIIKFNVFFI